MIKTLKTLGCAAVAGLSLSAFLAVPMASAQGELLKRKTVEETILESLNKARPDINFGQPRPSMIKGLYQVQVPGGPVLYVTPEGDKFIAGEIFGIDSTGFSKIEDRSLSNSSIKTLSKASSFLTSS